MNYNIHPLFVHFPIALLVVYSVLKILPLSIWFPNVEWKQIERALLGFGVLGAFAALATGDAAEQITKPSHQLVEMHSTFATVSTVLYGALLLGDVSTILNTINWIKNTKNLFVKKVFIILELILCNKILSGIVAFIGLLSITVTGLLGGAMVYGVTADPFANMVVQFLGITI